MNLGRCSYIHLPLNNSPSSHWKLNLSLETVFFFFFLHNRYGTIEAALLFSPYKGKCHDPFHFSHQLGCCTTSLLSVTPGLLPLLHPPGVRAASSGSPTETQCTWTTPEETTPFRGAPGPFHFTCRKAWVNPLNVCHLSGSGCDGESLMLLYCILTCGCQLLLEAFLRQKILLHSA